jgi:hypothetical protein
LKIIIKTIILSLLVVTLVSCSPFTPKPTPTSTPTQTSLPTPTNTPRPTNTSTKIPRPPTKTPSAPLLKMPSGKPVSEWEDIPVMPNAIAGEGDNQSYLFTIDSSSDEIIQFYKTELVKRGWELLATGQGKTNAVLLIFMKEGNTLSVSLIPQPDGIIYVLLVK